MTPETLASLEPMSDEEKIRENRLRRMAERQGLRLMKSSRRDRRAIDYGCYWLVGEDDAFYIPRGASLGTMRPVGFTIDEIENYLTRETGRIK